MELNPKCPLFLSNISEVNPDIFMIQETKMIAEGFLKIPGYKVFERTRKGKGGGGVAIGVKPPLKPVWVNEGEKQVEAISVVITVNKTKISPQLLASRFL